MFLLALLVGCADSDADDDDEPSDPPIGYYEAGWPIDACSTDFDADGTGYGIGDVLPQHTFVAQSDETVSLHDFCNQVVYIEIGYWT